MLPTEILRNEHRVIEQVLSCLEKIADGCAEGGALDRALAARALEFFRGFADQCHHAKEEVHLFPLLEAHGFVREEGPTGVMLREHERGRRHVQVMAALLDGAADGEPEAIHQFVTQARSFVGLLRDHIAKEDHCLFPLAELQLTEDDRAELLEGFRRVEAEEVDADAHEAYLRLAEELAGALGVPKLPLGVLAAQGCCHPVDSR